MGMALGSAALFGAATPACKPLLSKFAPLQLAGLLYLGAALGILPLVLKQRGKFDLRAVSRRTVWYLLGAVICGGILAPIFLLAGLRLAAAASVSLWLPIELVATAVVGLLFFRDHLGPMTWVGLGGVIAAGVLVGLAEGSSGLVPCLLVATACVLWGLDNNLTSLIDGISAAQCTLVKGVVAGITNITLGLFLSPFVASPGAVGWALLIGAGCYGASILFYISSSQQLGATRAQLFFASAPFFGVLLSAIALGEAISSVQILAACLLGGSLLVLQRERHGHSHVHESQTHVHSHRHDDQHHVHVHNELPSSGRHTHAHDHERIEHSHPHLPDLHHRHRHT